jgi:hypothetical protein
MRIVMTAGLATVVLCAAKAAAQNAQTTPASGFAVHVTAPHMIQGHEMGPVHHYCKTIAPDPIIQCLLYNSAEPNEALTGVEYIIAKTITRPLVTLGTWNANFHDHAQEIATGRVRVLDMPADEARRVAELVATTDGIIFHLWPNGDRIPTGAVEIGQAVGHKLLRADEYARSARRPQARREP